MKMKKLTALTASLVLGTALVFTGCSSDKDTKSTGNAAEDVQKIKDGGVFKVGVKVDVPKYGLKNTTTGEVEGLEVDIAKAVAKKIFGDESKIETTAVTAKTRGPLLDNGEIDAVIATFTITEERKQSYNFSDPYFTDGVGLLVKKSLGIKEFKELDGKTIGVAQSSTTKKALEDEAKKSGITLKFSEFGSYPEISAALDSGRIDCFSVDASILNGYLDDSKEILDFRTNPQEYGIATKKSNEGLAKLVNEVVSEMKSSGELDKLIAKWEIK